MRFESPEQPTTIPKLCIKPKPHLRILERHNPSRQFQYEQRHTVLKITDQLHDAIKQICDAWDIGIPVYLTYAIMSAVERDTGLHTKWLDPSKNEPTAVSNLHEIMPTTPPVITKQQEQPTAQFDPLAAL